MFTRLSTLLRHLDAMNWPEWLRPYVDSFVQWVNGVLEYWDLQYMEVEFFAFSHLIPTLYSTFCGFSSQSSSLLFCQYFFSSSSTVVLSFYTSMVFDIESEKLTRQVIGTGLGHRSHLFGTVLVICGMVNFTSI